MSLFFFDTYDGDTRVRDTDGMDFPTPETARLQGLEALPDMARDKLPDGDRRDFIVDVRDGTGRVIYTATLSLVGRWID